MLLGEFREYLAIHYVHVLGQPILFPPREHVLNSLIGNISHSCSGVKGLMGSGSDFA